MSNCINCPICWEELKEQDGKQELLCNHVFHKECLDRWILTTTMTTNTNVYCCPICTRKYFTEKQTISQRFNTFWEFQTYKKRFVISLYLFLIMVLLLVLLCILIIAYLLIFIIICPIVFLLRNEEIFMVLIREYGVEYGRRFILFLSRNIHVSVNIL